jgi:hypothetical protein
MPKCCLGQRRSLRNREIISLVYLTEISCVSSDRLRIPRSSRSMDRHDIVIRRRFEIHVVRAGMDGIFGKNAGQCWCVDLANVRYSIEHMLQHPVLGHARTMVLQSTFLKRDSWASTVFHYEAERV